MFLSDGIILTGSATGKSASPSELQMLLEMSNLPAIIGSGVTDENFGDFRHAHALIVGSHFKKGGVWKNEMCTERIQRFMRVARTLH